MASERDIIEAIVGGASRPNNASPRNQEVAQSIRRALVRAGEPLPEGGSDNGILGAGLSVLGRTFDILSRPLYGVTNVIENFQDEGFNRGIGGIGGQLWQGLSGQDKVTGSDLIENAGVENGVAQGVGGFALDIALDPLTYVGAGIVRNLSEEAIQTAGARAAQHYLQEAAEGGTAARIAQYSAEREARRRFMQEGVSLAEANAGARSVGEEFTRSAAEDAARVAQTQLRSEGPGRVVMNVLGRPVAGSERLYRGGRTAADAVKETRVGRALNKAFRPKATFVAGTNDTKRITEAYGMARMEREGNAIKHGGISGITGEEFPSLNSLTDDEAIEITNALEDLDSPYNGAFQEEVKSIRRYIRHIGEDEKGTFINDPSKAIIKEDDELIDNYVHLSQHSFDRSLDSASDIRAFLDARKADIRKTIKAAKAQAEKDADEIADKWAKEQAKQGRVLDDEFTEEFNQVRLQAYKEAYDAIPKTTSYTTARAIEEGLHPTTDIRYILGNHVQDHFRETGKVAFLDALAKEFGTEFADSKSAGNLARKLGLTKVPRNPYMPENVYFPREITNAIKQLDQVFYKDEAAGSGLLHLYDQALGYLKVGQTVINPGFHIRNAMSDISLNQLDGVVDPQVYGESFRIHRAKKSSTDPMGDLDPFVEGNPVDEITGDLSTISIPLNDSVDIDGRTLETLFERSGAKSGYYRTEVTVGGGTIERIRNMSEAREDWARRAHFIDALRKEMPKGVTKDSPNYYQALEDAAKKAGQRVRKYNIDYGDLTPFEQRTMKRIIPFYTWMRKNIPLQIEGLMMRPGRQMVTPKIIRNLQTMMGQSEEDVDILGLNSMPDYMRRAMYTQVIGEGEGRNGVYWNPGGVLPLMDLNEFFGEGTPRDLAERQLSGLTPFAQVPIQQITGYNFYSGRPQNKGILQNILETTPSGRYGYGIFADDQPLDSTRLVNLLTGAGLTSLSEGMQQGELRRQEDIVQELVRRRQSVTPPG